MPKLSRIFDFFRTIYLRLPTLRWQWSKTLPNVWSFLKNQRLPTSEKDDWQRKNKNIMDKRLRRKRMFERQIAKQLAPPPKFVEDEDYGGFWARNFVIHLSGKSDLDTRIGIEEKTCIFGGEVFYDWTFPMGLYEAGEVEGFMYAKNFMPEGAPFTKFSQVLPDSYILELDRFSPKGKFYKKIYVDMFFRKEVKICL